jgi:hypothetical protein
MHSLLQYMRMAWERPGKTFLDTTTCTDSLLTKLTAVCYGAVPGTNRDPGCS